MRRVSLTLSAWSPYSIDNRKPSPTREAPPDARTIHLIGTTEPAQAQTSPRSGQKRGAQHYRRKIQRMG